MARTETRLSDDEKKAWADFCAAQGLRESEMLRLLIERVTQGKVKIENQAFKKGKSTQINIRLSEQNLDLLDRRAEAEGFANRASWVTAVVLASLRKEPVLTKDEIVALGASTREMAAIGRNLNQVARMLNTEFRDSDKLKFDLIDQIISVVQHEKEKVSALIAKNMNRWTD